MDSSQSRETYSRSGKQPIDLALLEARVDKVHISGLNRTYDDYVQRAVRQLFNAKTFKDVLEETAQSRMNLTELGIFKTVHVTIDVSKGPEANPNGYEITFTGMELSRVTGSVGTEIGQNEGVATVELAAPNLCGRGERFAIHGSYGNNKTTDLNFKFTKPYFHTFIGDYKPEISFTFFKNSALLPWSMYNTHDIGILLDSSFMFPMYLNHSFQYECAMREIAPLGKQIPFFVREHCGPRMVSLFRHICSYDERDSLVLPTQGIFVKTTNEICGFGGNVEYFKTNTHGEINIPLFAGISAQLCGRVGLIRTHKKSPDVPISNLFILGGPTTLRGFLTGGAGRHWEGAARGTCTYWATGAHLWTPLPFNRYFGMLGNHLRMHIFGNAGNVDSFSLENCRTSIGAGLAFRIGERARIEMNYCKPIQRHAADRVIKEGFQFGIGYEFV